MDQSGVELLEYVMGLAPQGETAVITRQKPVIHRGEPVLHKDGSPRYTWPAFLPTHNRRSGEAWFINTGSFIIDRFVGGKISASAANIEYTLFMMCDDVGTKAKPLPLTPTWVVETSPGNFQHCYVWREAPTKGEHAALMCALAEAGYTDPGATNPVRNCRLPGSVNLKPEREGFACRLVEFNPRAEYTYEDICAAAGVTPAEPDASTHAAIRIRDTGGDVVLKWLAENSLVLTPANAEGWLGVVCPNNAEHTDGQIEGRYMPANRAYKCMHGHCAEWDSKRFLGWVCDNGGPEVTHGLRDDLFAKVMDTALGKISPTETFPDAAAETIAEVVRKEAGRLTKAEWFGRYAYIVADDSYFDMKYRVEYARSAFNAIYRHVHCKSVHDGKRKVEASVCFDENRQDKGAPILAALIYAPGEGALVTRDGEVYGNRWIDARPDVSTVKSTSVAPWLDHCKKIVENQLELDHCLDVMAFKLQNPRVKINHAILHGGKEGCGKDTMWAPFIWSVCGPAVRNRGFLDNDTMHSQWGYHLESEILLLNELKEPEAVQRRALANRLKPIIAAPPETLQVNRKGRHPYDTLNRLMVLAFTNDPVPISLPSQDRRWFCLWSSAPRMDEKEATALWRWYENGGYEAVACWLKARDVSRFNPAAPPLLTEWKLNMIEDGMSMSEGFLVDMIRHRRGEFAKGVVAAPLHGLVDRLQGVAPDGKKLHLQALLHALVEVGWTDRGRIKSARHLSLKRVFCAPDMMKMSNSELRDLAEEAPEPGAVHLKVVK